MKRLLSLFLLALPMVLHGQTAVTVRPDYENTRTFVAPGNGPCWPIPAGIGFHTIRWTEVTAISAGTLKLQGSNICSNDVMTSPSDIIAAQAITASGAIVGTEGVYRYVQLVVASQEGGQLDAWYGGYKSASASISGTVTANLSTTDNAVLDDIADGITVQIQSAGTAVPLITDPCDGQDKTSVPFSTSTATTTELANASASNKMYICGFIVWPVSAAQTLALVEDDTDTCASPTAGIIGGVTAATGAQIPAGGGFVSTNGGATVAKTAATNRYVCIITSTTAVTPGVLTYVLAP